MTENGQRWLRTVIDIASVLALLMSGYVYLDARFDALEAAMNDRWSGADMMLWVSSAEQSLEKTEREAHKDAPGVNHIYDLPNPYDIRRQRKQDE